MSKITFACAHCSQELESPEESAGTDVVCPTCNKQIKVPQNTATNDTSTSLELVARIAQLESIVARLQAQLSAGKFNTLSAKHLMLEGEQAGMGLTITNEDGFLQIDRRALLFGITCWSISDCPPENPWRRRDLQQYSGKPSCCSPLPRTAGLSQAPSAAVLTSPLLIFSTVTDSGFHVGTAFVARIQDYRAMPAS